MKEKSKRFKVKLNEFHQKVVVKRRKTTLKKKVRDMARLFEKLKKGGLAIDPIKFEEYERLKNQFETESKQKKKNEKIDKKYQKYKFFELKKLSRAENRTINLI